jgi:hypothetical protein
MNNPDEKTAVEQFGKGDKYFGVCTVLATLPGLPMFGHGQLEGYSEKYGMEFRRPKWDETPDDDLMQAHHWRIFPLLHRRSLFADVENFLLFDLQKPYSGLDENVFAYSNRLGEERGLVIYHNKFSDTKGWIKNSAAALDKGSGKLVRRTLADGLGLPRRGYVIFKDYSTQLEYVRSCEEIWNKGMYVELGAYQCHAFMDFRFVHDKEWEIICNNLKGAGVPSLQEEWRKTFVETEEVTTKEVPVKKKRATRKPVTKKATAKANVTKKATTKKSVAKKPIKKATVLKNVEPKAKKQSKKLLS